MSGRYTARRYLQLAVQMLVWVLSLLMFKFEFKRALGHVWYVHPLLWGYCTLYYTFETYY